MKKDSRNLSVKQKSERVIYLDSLRILAVFAVIVLHVAASNFYSVSVESIRWKIFNVADSCCRFAVPILFMISGSMFLDKKRDFSIRKLYLKNILRIFIA